MGYTNTYRCWTPSPEQAQAVINDIEQLMAQSGVSLDVTRLDGKIKLNGARQHGAEIFEWPASPTPPDDTSYLEQPEWLVVYCKTYRRKYDMVVLAALLSIKHHVPDATIDTDDTVDLAAATYDIQHRQHSRGCRSIAELLQKMQWNEFSKMHQKGINLYRKTFPDRPLEKLLPWQPIT